jgi:hypothetical protein
VGNPHGNLHYTICPTYAAAIAITIVEANKAAISCTITSAIINTITAAYRPTISASNSSADNPSKHFPY